MSLYLIVKMREGANHDRVLLHCKGGVLHCTQDEDVEFVSDMEVISPYTYEQWMLPRQQSLFPPAKRIVRASADSDATSQRDKDHVPDTQPHRNRRSATARPRRR